MGQSRSPGSTFRPVQPPTSNAISQGAKTLTAPPLVLALNTRTLGTGSRAFKQAGIHTLVTIVMDWCP